MRHAVITGDLIDSTSAPPAALVRAMDLLSACIGRIESPATFTRFRGDGWQVHLEEAGLGLATMAWLAAELRAAGGLQSRMALGLGTATGTSDPTLASASGSAFVASGRALDHMARGRTLAIAGEGVDRLHQSLLGYIEAQIAGWSHEQAEAVAAALAPGKPRTHAQIADRLGITRQAVTARLSAAGLDLLNRAGAAFLDEFGESPPDA